jgi:membrane-associated protein
MFDVTNIIQSGGLLLLGLFLFAEVGLFLGFFLPGDTLLITAGIYAAQGKFNVVIVILVGAIAAIAGDNTSYLIGFKAGPKVFKKKDSVIFDPDHVAKAEKFYDRYGSKTVLVAHYLPVVRTFTPLFAGVAKMPHKKYFILDAIGDTSWAIILTLVGYYIGNRIPNIDHYILYVVLAVVIASSGPTIIQWIRLNRRKNKKNLEKNKTKED